MKNLIAAAVLAMPFALNLAFVQTARQGRMADCNKEAKDMKGDERKKFTSECLKKG